MKDKIFDWLAYFIVILTAVVIIYCFVGITIIQILLPGLVFIAILIALTWAVLRLSSKNQNPNS